MITIQTAQIDEHKLTLKVARQFRIMWRSFRWDELAKGEKRTILCFANAHTLDKDLRDSEMLGLVDYGNGEYRWVFPALVAETQRQRFEEKGYLFDKVTDAPFVILL